nr:hypothetical protein [Acidobacteriota bacterium]
MSPRGPHFLLGHLRTACRVGLLALAAWPAAAQVAPVGQEIQVSAAQAFQSAPAVAGDGFGDFVVVWQRPEGAGPGCDLMVQIYHADPTQGVVAFGSPLQA